MGSKQYYYSSFGIDKQVVVVFNDAFQHTRLPGLNIIVFDFQFGDTQDQISEQMF